VSGGNAWRRHPAVHGYYASILLKHDKQKSWVSPPHLNTASLGYKRLEESCERWKCMA
jgi:hypothetical protein